MAQWWMLSALTLALGYAGGARAQADGVDTSTAASQSEVVVEEKEAQPETESEPSSPDLSQLSEQLESTKGSVDFMQPIVEALAKIKLSGYIQARYEYHRDSKNGVNALGRPQTTSMFLVRRGRLKTTYSGQYAELMLQIDATG